MQMTKNVEKTAVPDRVDNFGSNIAKAEKAEPVITPEN